MKLDDAIIMYEYEVREANRKLEIMRAVQKGEDALFTCTVRVGRIANHAVSAQLAQKWDWNWVLYDFKKVVPPQKAYIIRDSKTRVIVATYLTVAEAQMEITKYKCTFPDLELIKFVEERK